MGPAHDIAVATSSVLAGRNVDERSEGTSKDDFVISMLVFPIPNACKAVLPPRRIIAFAITGLLLFRAFVVFFYFLSFWDISLIGGGGGFYAR